ncbi:unannotated protein [freshwater metagenome]|uniref:Unannotated protein n=1 Tax=freshwater metagenome TaxID=449393 RepID=A0A6J7QSJ7_9ZZZZ
MQWRVDDPGLARGLLADEAGDLRDVVVEHIVAQCRPLIAERNRAKRPARDIGDACADLGIGWRDDLRALAEVHLVAVVLWWVVACGDHDPGGAAEVPDGVCEHRSGQRPGEQERGEAGARENRRGVAGEDIGVMARVEPNGNAAATTLAEVRGEARRGLHHDHPVHPVRPGAEASAQPGSAELKATGEGIGQFGRGSRIVRPCGLDGAEQFGSRAVVRILRSPRLGLSDEPGPRAC